MKEKQDAFTHTALHQKINELYNDDSENNTSNVEG